MTKPTPANVIQQQMEIHRMKPEDLAYLMSVPLPTVQGLLNGTTQIDQAIATQLASVLGVSDQYWLQLQQRHNHQQQQGKQ